MFMCLITVIRNKTTSVFGIISNAEYLSLVRYCNSHDPKHFIYNNRFGRVETTQKLFLIITYLVVKKLVE